MQKVLITGASGTIGYALIEELLKNSNYEITSLDLKSGKSVSRLKKLKKDINIIYGDINDFTLMKALVKDHDFIIHLAGIIPPFASISGLSCHINDFEGTKTIIDAINETNPDCFLIYASTTALYGKNKQKDVNTKNKIKIDWNDNYSLVNMRNEEIISQNIKNYAIFRISVVLGNLKTDAPMYNIPIDSIGEFIYKDDCALAFAQGIKNYKKINHLTLNITGGIKCLYKVKDYLMNILKIHGLSFRFLGVMFLVDKNFYIHEYTDSIDANKILNFQKTSIDDYFVKVKKETNKIRRFIPKLLAIPVIFIIKYKTR